VLTRLFIVDARWSERLRIVARPGPGRVLAILLAHSGDSPWWLIGLALTLWLGSALWQREALLDLIGLAMTAAVVQGLKLIIRRPRPAGEWGAIYRRVDPHSFPSGHAARAMMLAVIALILGPVWWSTVLMVWAPLVSLARVAMGVPYLSDVAAGMVLGIMCGAVVGLLFR
jgi:undecaprenyl-diphosphatase